MATYRDIDFIIFNTHYTHRIIDNYEDYQSRIDSFSQINNKKFLLYGVYVCTHSFGYNDHPFLYPAHNINVMEQIKSQIDRIDGSILIKNCFTENLSHDFLELMISQINDFCGFFDMHNVIEENIKEVMINNEHVRILFMSFDTESG